jgi:glycerophosphoryl diester phosphodiesterase
MRAIKKMGIALLYLSGLLILMILVFVPFSFSKQAAEGISSKKPAIIAHRGASAVAPENTLPAIKQAMLAEPDYIEIDVQLSKDRKVVLMHDRTVNRTTNGQGRIAELDWPYLKTLDAGSWFGKSYTGTRIPLLEDVIRLVNGQTKLLIEIKNGDAGNVIEKEVADLIEKHQAADWCEVQSFSDEILENMHEYCPDIHLHKLFILKFRFLPIIFDGSFTRFSFDKYAFIKSFNIHKTFGNASFLHEIHDQGKKAIAWGCNKATSCPGSMENWDGIITNYPEKYK